VIFQAFFDESERSAGGVFAVAGFAFRKTRVKKLNAQWKKLFAQYDGFCHMTDLNARQGQFKGIGDKEASRLTIEAIAIINEHASFGSAVACDLAEIDAHLPKWIEGYGHAYPFLCHQAMHRLGALISQSGRNDEAAYIFESGHEKQKEAERFMKLVETPEMKTVLRHRSHSFVPKKDAPPLQAADIFVWEYAKYWDDTVGKRKIPMRKSLQSILTSGYTTSEFQKRFKLDFLTGPPLWRALEQTGHLGLMQLAEEHEDKLHRLIASGSGS
jgi:hypothetical protein